MSAKVKALVVRLKASPVVEEVGSDLDSMKALVGGWIELVKLGRGFALWCNENGIAEGLPPNRVVRGPGGEHVIHGDFFFTRLDAEGEPVSLAGADDAWLRDTLWQVPAAMLVRS